MESRLGERGSGSAVEVGAMTDRAVSRIDIRAALDLRGVRSHDRCGGEAQQRQCPGHQDRSQKARVYVRPLRHAGLSSGLG